MLPAAQGRSLAVMTFPERGTGTTSPSPKGLDCPHATAQETIAMPPFKTSRRFGATPRFWATALLWPLFAWAQGTGTAPTPGPTEAPSEAVARQAQGPYRMILSNVRPAPKVKPTAGLVSRRKAPEAPTAQPEAPPVPTIAAPPAAAEPLVAANPLAAAAPAPAPLAPPAPPLAVAAATAPTPEPAPARAAREPAALVALQQDPPVISSALMKEVPHGLVKLSFEVLPDGSTAGIRVASSTHRKLSAAATAALAQWRFAPIDEKRASEIEFVFSYE